MSVVVNCELPENWKKSKIGDFAHTTSGGTPKRSSAEFYGGDVPWVKSGDLNDSALFSVDEYISELGLEKSSAKLFAPGTVLIALYGATIGRLSILQFEASTNQAVCGITVPKGIDNKYLLREETDFSNYKRQPLSTLNGIGQFYNDESAYLRRYYDNTFLEEVNEYYDSYRLGNGTDQGDIMISKSDKVNGLERKELNFKPFI